MSNRMARTGVSTLAALILSSSTAVAFSAKDLDGYWTGTGTVRLASGNTEQVKCVVTYRVDNQNVRQSLRCASAAYKINGRAEFKITGTQIDGSWEETNYSAQGVIAGKTNDGGFALTIKGQTFSAQMSATLSGCRQQIEIEPQGLEVTKISIGLGKC